MNVKGWRSLGRWVENILRGRPSSFGDGFRDLTVLGGLVATCGFGYGVVMGSYGGWEGSRAWQLVVSGIKVPLLLVATFGLVLPGYFVLNTILGLRTDFPRALRAALLSQAAIAIILVSLAPLTAVWYASSEDYPSAVLFNAAAFAIASVGAQTSLRRAYRPLIARDRRHLLLLRGWLVVYAFVGIQLAWLLRPFVGDPTSPVRFLRGGAWENAYVIVGRLVWDRLGGG